MLQDRRVNLIIVWMWAEPPITVSHIKKYLAPKQNAKSTLLIIVQVNNFIYCSLRMKLESSSVNNLDIIIIYSSTNASKCVDFRLQLWCTHVNLNQMCQHVLVSKINCWNRGALSVYSSLRITFSVGIQIYSFDK